MWESAHYLLVGIPGALSVVSTAVAVDLEAGSASMLEHEPRDRTTPPPASGIRHANPATAECGGKRLSKKERAKNERRVHTLFVENYRSIWRLLRRFGVPEHHADDSAQKVFLILAERIMDVKSGSERAFLYGTAFRVATGFRRMRHREEPTDLADEHRSTLPRPDELADRKRARDVLDHLLAQMDDDLKTVFILYEMEGFTTPEIADVLEVPLGTAASKLRRAREKFQLLITEYTAKRGGS